MHDFSVERTSAQVTSNMEASWLVTRNDDGTILYVQAQGHPQLLEQLEIMLNEGFTVNADG